MLCSSFTVYGQVVADFSATPISGCAPLVVQFTDNSAGSPSSWSWDFGNGNSATQKNPVVTYNNPGVYSVQLTVSNTSGSNSITKNQYITVYDNPIVQFTVNDSLNCIPFTTRFTDLSTCTTGNITSWQWDFDDGATSTVKNPQHLYTQAGAFNITLQVTTSGGCTKSLSKLAYIKAADSIRTQFNFSLPVKCKPPEKIFFYNNSTGPGSILYTWDFGNGNTTNTFSASQIYTAGGLYSITLTARNDFGCTDTLILKDTLLIKDIRSAIISDDTVCVNYRMLLTNGTVPAPLSSQWLYSDGGSSFSATTAKTWTNPGDYTVKLVSNFNACSDSVTKNIRVLPSPVIDFSASDPAACRVPFSVTFADLTAGATSWYWDFGDGTSSTLQNPLHTFTTEGEYDVTLRVNSAAGCQASLTKKGFIKVHRPRITIDTKEGGGCLPYVFTPYPFVNAPDGVNSFLWDFDNGQTSSSQLPTAVYTDPGNYNIKLVVTSTDGCVDSLIIPAGVRTAGIKPVIDFNLSPAVVCPGSNVQFTHLTAPADKWMWKFGDGTTSEIPDPAHAYYDSGRYSVKLIAWNNGCDDSLTKTGIVTVLPGRARFRPVYNCINKKEVFFKDNSVLPQSWNWDFGDGSTSTEQNPVHSFSNYQTYTVSLTTTNAACSSTTTLQVKTVNEVADFIASKASICKSDSVLFYTAGINRNNIKKMIWDFGDGVIDSLTGDSVQHLYSQPGNFSIQLSIVDTNGCYTTISKSNLIFVSDPKASFTITTLNGCRNQPVSFNNTSTNEAGRNNISSWKWDFGDGETQNNIQPFSNPVTHNYSITGYYYPSLKIIDSAGCADSIAYAVPVRVYQPDANFFAPNFNTCKEDTLIIRNPSTGSGLTYLWSFGDGSFSSDSLPVKQYTSNGDYTIKLVVTDVAGCKDSLSRVNYAKVRDVSASFTVSDSTGTCTPFQVKFYNTSLNALSQLWDFGDGGFSSTVNPVYSYADRGSYTVRLTARRSNRCFKTDSIKIIVQGIDASLQYRPLAGCAPLAVSLNVVSDDSLTYSWDFNDGVVFSSSDSATTHTYTYPGQFMPSVVVKDTAGCFLQLTGADTIKLFSSRVNFSAIDSSVCFGDSVYFYDSTTTGSTITGHRWEFGDGSYSTEASPVHFYTIPGTYTIKLFVSTAFGCLDSLVKPGFIRVSVTPDINIAGNEANYCGQSMVSFTGNTTTTDTAATYWKWNFGNGQTSSIKDPAAQQYKDTGLYNIQLIMNYSTGCADTASSTIRILPVPNTFAGNDTAICEGASIMLHASGADNYTWRPDIHLSCTNCNDPLSNSPNSILYYVSGVNSAGCEKTDSVFIELKKPFVLNSPSDSGAICSGKSLQLLVNGAENYYWSPANGLSNTNTANPVASPVTNTIYTVVGYDSINCFRDTAFMYVEVYPLPSVNAGNDFILNEGKEVTLSPQYSNDVIQWNWYPPIGLNCTNCASPVATPSDGTTYKIEVTNGNGCTSSDEIFVQLKCDRSNIYMPAAFSPNGINKIFCPLTLPGTGTLKIAAFKIYNRIGGLVYTNGNFNTNDHSSGWNGKYQGADAPAGTYVYTVEFVCSSGKVVSFAGNILLLR